MFFMLGRKTHYHENRFVTEISTVLMDLMNFCVPINQLRKYLLVMRGQDVQQARCIAIVQLNVWPWTRFCAIFQLNAKIKSTKGFVVISRDPVVSCGVRPNIRQSTTTSSLYSPHDATTYQSAMI